MSIRIYCNNKQILHLRNITFGSLYESIINLIEDKNIELEGDLEIFFKEILYLGQYGWSFKVNEHLKKKHDTIFFADLLKEAIEKEQKSKYPFREDVEKLLWDFHQEILSYTNTLKE